MIRHALMVAVLALTFACYSQPPEESATPTSTGCPSLAETDFHFGCAPLQGVTCDGVVLCVGYAAPAFEDPADPNSDVAFMWDGEVAVLCDGSECVDIGNAYCAQRHADDLVTPVPAPGKDGEQ